MKFLELFVYREISWMIDASHNLKDPMEDLLQSITSIKISFDPFSFIDVFNCAILIELLAVKQFFRMPLIWMSGL